MTSVTSTSNTSTFYEDCLSKEQKLELDKRVEAWIEARRKTDEYGTLDLSHLALKAINESDFEEEAFGFISEAREVNLSNNLLSSIPIVLEKFLSLSRLYLANNLIKDLSNQSFAYSLLSQLDLSHNKISFIDGSLNHINDYLNLSFNPLSIFPFKEFNNPKLIVVLPKDIKAEENIGPVSYIFK
jgi:Leucine-rich repeat (LRR) protein